MAICLHLSLITYHLLIMQLNTFILYICILFQQVYSSEVTRVNDKNFNELVINSNKFTLVDFYADWCRHCKNLMPTIEDLAFKFKEYPDIQIIKVNGDDDGKRLVKKFGIDGFPDLRLFHGKDEPIEFHGSRDLKSLSNFVQAISGIRLDPENEDEVLTEDINENNSIISVNDDNFKEIVTQIDGKTALLFSATWCGACEKFKPTWEKLASHIYINDNSTIQFGSVEVGQESTKELKLHFGIKTLPTVLFFDANSMDSDGIPVPEIYEGKKELSSLIGHINKECLLARNEDGKLSENSGIIPHINTFLQEQLAIGIDKVSLSVLALKELDDINPLNANNDIAYYRTLFNSVIEGEDGFFNFELTRLSNVLQLKFDDLPSLTVDSYQRRFNILNTFINILNK